MAHTRGRPYHPMTQGKIERYHRSTKNILLLENFYGPGDEGSVRVFYRSLQKSLLSEALNNLTPADVYCGKDCEILTRRDKAEYSFNTYLKEKEGCG